MRVLMRKSVEVERWKRIGILEFRKSFCLEGKERKMEKRKKRKEFVKEKIFFL